MNSPGPSRNPHDNNSSTPAGESSSSSGSQPAGSQNNQGQRVNFPQVLQVGRHIDGDTDEINVIVCTQRARRRYAGELPRCYTFGWRHINNFEVPPMGKPSLMPPKFGQEREVAGYWKERVIGSMDHPTWEGDQDEDAEEDRRLLNYIEKREDWKEGNYVSYGTGSASAFEKIQGMHVPLHSYEAHRRIREDLWSAERVAANMAKQHAKVLKHHMLAEEQKRKAEAAQSTILSAGASTSKATTSVAHPSTSTQMASAEQPHASTSSASSSTAPTSSAVVKSKAVPGETKETTPKAHPPQTTPVDRRFAPENMPEDLPWYRRLWNGGSSPTGWTSDERYAHRTYIIPHPLYAAKENLVRSWKLVLTPTWKLTKALAESFTSGTQRRFWNEMWTYSAERKQWKLLSETRTLFQQKIAEEQEKQREQSAQLLKAAREASAEIDKEVESLEKMEKDGKMFMTSRQKAELTELKRRRAANDEEIKKHLESLDKKDGKK